jgi:L-ascorbate metabolism protein UlaG (beta-lactamase superfamily)
MAGVPLTWLGHAAFRFDTPSGKRVYVDPFLAGNPKCPEAEQEPERCDLILLTHGHDDHFGSTLPIWRAHRPRVIAPNELRWWLEGQGVEGASGNDPNPGGTVDADGIRVSVTVANHSSSYSEAGYTGASCGLVVDVEGATRLYFAGDTNVFGDMQLIARLYEPDVAILPIGDHYTMGPKEAALALELLGAKRCVPCHYGTFPLLHGTPDQLRELAPGVEVLAPQPGETIEV